MTDPLIARRDLDFLLYEWLEIETLFERQAFAEHSRETVDAMLDVAQQSGESAGGVAPPASRRTRT